MESVTLLRRAPLFCLLTALMLTITACDSNGGGGGFEGEDLSGTYSFETLQFDATGLDVTVNVRDSLATGEVQVVGGQGSFFVFYSFPGEQVNSLQGSFGVDGETATFDVEEGDRADILLPDRFELQIEEDGTLLQGTTDEYEVNLGGFGINQTLNGTLELRLSRE